MRQDVSKGTMNNLKKKYQISFRRFITAKSGGGSVAPHVGADRGFIRTWISNKLLKDMTWNNYGSVWVIDHIVPLRLFDMTNPEELKIAFHYKNITPLYKEDNLYKEGSIDFSLFLLDRIPQCDIVHKLRERLLQENMRLRKYLD